MDAKAQEFIDQLTNDPLNVELRKQFGGYLLAIGDTRGAKTQYEMAAKLAPDDDDIKKGLLLAEASSGTAGDRTTSSDASSAAKSHSETAADTPVKLKVVAGGDSEVKGTNVEEMTDRRNSISFADIVGMDDLKRTVRVKIIEPFAKPEIFSKFGKRSGGGILLYGPPGCGKTLLGKAIATECGAEFVHVDISDILNMYIGQSEQNIRQVFEYARDNAPAVLFFDEFDALALSRTKSNSDHTRTTVNELLAQLDGIGSNNENLLIMAATNMPWDIDGAAKRPGRFNRQVFVPPLDAPAREELFRRRLRSIPCTEFSLQRLVDRTHLCSGADIDGIVDEAKEAVIGEIIDTGKERPLTEQDLLTAVQKFPPSTTDWLKTTRNLIKFGGVDREYREVVDYLKSVKF